MSGQNADVKKKAQQWLDSKVVDQDTKNRIQDLLKPGNESELINNFYKDLEFGTGGLRGIMGAGTNCMNRYTVGVATQGLCNYMLKSFKGKKLSVAIAHDSRNNSRYFAEVAAGIFSANGIVAHLFPALRPTPLLSYAIRYLKCDGGIVVTASHNPKEYNGYKAYWNDGAQVVPPHDENIIKEVNAIGSFEEVRFEAVKENILSIGSEVERAYYQEVVKVIPAKDIIARHNDIPLVYSSLHGAGITMVPECLKILGFTNVHVVQEQKEPDGNFPTVTSPNPEESSAMKLAIQYGKENDASLVMATDPDTDRVGIGVRKHDGEFILLNGNQAFSLMIAFILKSLKEKTNAYIVKTVVTTELIDTMAKAHGITCYNTLTGFKYIASLIGEKEGSEKFVAAGEESYGYMVGDFVRDKDAVSACAFFATMSACAKDQGQSLYDWLIAMYVEHGYYKEQLINVTKKGKEGAEEITKMMTNMRNDPPEEFAGERVLRMLDYKTSKEKNLKTGEEKTLSFPSSDVLQFYLADGSKVSVRPSGTEPKIKFYISVHEKLASTSEFDGVTTVLEKRISKIADVLRSI